MFILQTYQVTHERNGGTNEHTEFSSENEQGFIHL